MTASRAWPTLTQRTPVREDFPWVRTGKRARRLRKPGDHEAETALSGGESGETPGRPPIGRAKFFKKVHPEDGVWVGGTDSGFYEPSDVGRRPLNTALCLMEMTVRLGSTKNLGDRIIKVNHAGEHGAICIYSGQITMARLTAPSMVGELTEFRSHEQGHRAIFNAELHRRGQPRCRSYWLCGLGGYVLGLVTGLLGSSAIAATTVAVESVVLRHLEQQLQALRGHDPAAVAAISAIVAEERQHRDQSAPHVQAGKFWPKVLTPIVSTSTEAVIWLGMRL